MRKSINRRTFASGMAAVSAVTVMPRAFAQTPAASPAASPAAEGPRVIHAANGEIEITGTPSKIVAMEYELVEHLQTVGITPIGASERDSVNEFVPLPMPLPETVVDLGTRDEPDLEALVLLEPDLILAASPRQDEVLGQLEAIAPTVQLKTYSPFFAPTEGETSIDQMKTVLRDVATATNTTETAEDKITEFDELLAACAGRLAQIGYKDQPYVYGSIPLSDTNTVNLFSDKARITGVVSGLGLANAITEDMTPEFHYQEISIEQIGTLPEDILFFFSRSESTNERIEATLNSDTWKAAGFVKNENVIDLGEPNLWTAGGILTMTDLINRVMMALEMRNH